MKTLDPGFAAHVASRATTLANCWRLSRKDGLVLGFTDHDIAFAFDGTEFMPHAGANGSELTTKTGAATDTSEILGILSSAAISEDDIRLGRYDGTAVEIWRVNWRNPSERCLLRRDTIGEITCEDTYFKAELRSAELALNVEKGRLYQSLCGSNLGETPCGIDLNATVYSASAIVVSLTGRNQIEIAGLSGFSSDWFMHGVAVWSAGQRLGVKDRITGQHRRDAADYVSFQRDISDWVAIGDTLTMHAGCDRRFSTCRSKFQNTLNFRGFPHIPGSDFVLKYPKNGDVLAGAPLVK